MPPTEDLPSRRTRRQRREALEIKDLADALMALPPTLVDRAGLPDVVREAIATGHDLTAHVARDRQLKRVASLLRLLDEEELDALRDVVEHGDPRSAVVGRRAERWRERLLDDDHALTLFVEEHPGVDVQRLRQLLRNVRRDRGGSSGRRAARELLELVNRAVAAEDPGG